jgi:hypothetical protein
MIASSNRFKSDVVELIVVLFEFVTVSHQINKQR